MLYFENLSGVKEDEYFRDGITEDIITELSKIKGLKIFSRPTVLAYRDKPVTPAQIGQQLGAAYVLAAACAAPATGCASTRSSWTRTTDFPLWSERYDREMQDVFEVQDEIARKIAEALRITLTPQEQAALAAKPTENLQAYDLYLRGKSYARRLTRQDLEFALQMFENAVALDPKFALAYAAIANVCAQHHYNYGRDPSGWSARRPRRARDRAAAGPAGGAGRPRRGCCTPSGQYDEAIRIVRQAIARKPDCEGGYYLLGRALFAAGRYQELADIAEAAIGRVRRGLQRLRADPERARRARQDRGAAQHAPAAHPGAREAHLRRCPRTCAPGCCSASTTRTSAAPRTRCAR